MRAVLATLLATIGLVGCEPVDSVNTPIAPPVTTSPDMPATPSTVNDTPALTPAPTTPEPTPPDNTAVNDRDASGATKTPIDQDENQPDINTTAEIRQRILAQDGMSINARNAKVITSQGKVTLRGPVESDAEKEALDRIAREVAGAQNVDNQLEVNKPE